MTWLELYNHLHQKANDIKNLDSHFWNTQVMAHNDETGDEYTCDIWNINQRSVILFNFSEAENN